MNKFNKINEPWHDKTNKISVRPAKTQISLGIRPVWSESSLCIEWVAKDPSFLHVDSKDWSDWVDAKAHLDAQPFCRGSNAVLSLLEPASTLMRKHYQIFNLQHLIMLWNGEVI